MIANNNRTDKNRIILKCTAQRVYDSARLPIPTLKTTFIFSNYPPATDNQTASSVVFFIQTTENFGSNLVIISKNFSNLFA